MKLDQALATNDSIETNWATNMEKGWIELSILKVGTDEYTASVVYDIIDGGPTLTAPLDKVKAFLKAEQGISPDDDVWVVKTAPGHQ